MKTKEILKKWRMYVVLLLGISLFSTEIHSAKLCVEHNMKNTVPMVCGGDWGSIPKTRSLTPESPTASINGNLLIIENPSRDCDIEISITDDEGFPVYEQTVPAASTGYIPIPLGGFPSGTYTLTLRNPSGGYLYGSFTLD